MTTSVRKREKYNKTEKLKLNSYVSKNEKSKTRHNN